MAIWDKFKQAKAKLFDGIDSLDNVARDRDVSADAREQQLQGDGPTEVSGGVDALEAIEAQRGGTLQRLPLEDVSFPQEEVTEITEVHLPVLEDEEDDETLGAFLVDDRELGDEDIESEELEIPFSGQRFPNALNIADVLVETSLRMQHYPDLDAPAEHLHVLAHAEHELLMSSAYVGYALNQLVTQVIEEDVLWASAVLYSGMLVDGEVRDALAQLAKTPSEPAARNLCWAAEPFLDDVVGAAQAGDAWDAVGLAGSVRDLQHWLVRWRGTAVDLGVEPDPPLEATGLHRLPGFRWS